jgi:diaminobutyrate-2-oxoglutarate transaminase
MVTISKSIGGLGLPMALLLLKPELDLWSPGEHNGTFRGNQLAFIGGAAALDLIRETGLEAEVNRKGALLTKLLHDEIGALSDKIAIRGVGLIQGVDLAGVAVPSAIQPIKNYCFEHGLIVELVGRDDVVIKLLPALTIEDDLLVQGCMIIKDAIQTVLGSYL